MVVCVLGNVSVTVPAGPAVRSDRWRALYPISDS